MSLVAVAALILAVGCGSQQSEPTVSAPEAPATGGAEEAPAEEAAAPAEAKVWRIGMSQCNLGEPWRVQMNEDVKVAADSFDDVEVVFKDAQNDTLKQRSQMEEFINDEMDLIIISPKEAAPLTPIVAEAYNKGIPVIVLDRAVLGEDYTTFIGANNYLIGKAAGEWIVEKLGGSGNVVELMGLMTSVPGQDRHNGFRDGIAGSDIKVIFEADMEWLESNARTEMESALAVHDNIDLVYAHNDPGAHGAYMAASAAGREGEMMFVGIDGLAGEGQVYVKDNVLSATFVYPTGGQEAIELAREILSGGEAPKKIVLNSKMYTTENIADGGKELIFTAPVEEAVEEMVEMAEDVAEEAVEAAEEAVDAVEEQVEDMGDVAQETMEEMKQDIETPQMPHVIEEATEAAEEAVDTAKEAAEAASQPVQ